MNGEDRRFEIVADAPLPLLKRSCEALGQRHGRHGRTYARIGFACGDRLVGLHDHELQPREIQFDGPHHLAPPRAELRRVANEKSRIAAERRGTPDELLFREVQSAKFVHGENHRRGIGRSSAQPRAEGHPLVEHDRDAPHAVARPHQPHGPHAQIVVRRTVEGEARRTERILPGAFDLHPIEQPRHGHHHRLQIVITVFAATEHVETDIYFAVGMSDHAAKVVQAKGKCKRVRFDPDAFRPSGPPQVLPFGKSK